MSWLGRKIKGNSLGADATRRLLGDSFAVWSFIIIVVYAAVAASVKFGWLAADWQAEIGSSRAAPSFDQGWKFWFGLDLFGRSVSAKILQGTYTALYVGLMTSLISIPIGVILGALAGYYGGLMDDAITWLYTTISNIPDVLRLVAISFALGKGINAVVFALGTTTWVSLARLIRGEVMKHKNREYVAAAAALGSSHFRRLFIHIIPNVMHIVIISFSLRFVTAIKSEVVLTYLGLGAQSGMASWGLMIDDAKGELMQGIWYSLAGVTLAMFLVVLAFSLFSDALRDAFDPKLRA